MFAADETGVLHHSSDNGESWTAQTVALAASDEITAIGPARDFPQHPVVHLGLKSGRILTSKTAGEVFSPAASQLDSAVMAMTPQPGTAVSHSLGSYDVGGGGHWIAHTSGLTTHSQADAEDLPQFAELAATEKGGQRGEQYLAGFDGLFRRELDTGGGWSPWSEVPTLPLEMPLTLAVSPDFANDSTLVTGTYWRGLFLSPDAGTSWRSINDGLGTVDETGKVVRIHSVAFSPDYARDGTLFGRKAEHSVCIFRPRFDLV